MSEINIIENIDNMDNMMKELTDDPKILALWQCLKNFTCGYCNNKFTDSDFIICDNCECKINFSDCFKWKDTCKDCYFKSLCEFTYNIYKKYNKLYCNKCLKYDVNGPYISYRLKHMTFTGDEDLKYFLKRYVIKL